MQIGDVQTPPTYLAFILYNVCYTKTKAKDYEVPEYDGYDSSSLLVPNKPPKITNLEISVTVGFAHCFLIVWPLKSLRSWLFFI